MNKPQKPSQGGVGRGAPKNPGVPPLAQLSQDRKPRNKTLHHTNTPRRCPISWPVNKHMSEHKHWADPNHTAPDTLCNKNTQIPSRQCRCFWGSRCGREWAPTPAAVPPLRCPIALWLHASHPLSISSTLILLSSLHLLIKTFSSFYWVFLKIS